MLFIFIFLCIICNEVSLYWKREITWYIFILATKLYFIMITYFRISIKDEDYEGNVA